MAAGKSKQKSTRQKATRHELEVLKAAKARGLIKIDLRKGLSKYARSKVKTFEPVYRQEAAVVKVPRKAAAKFAGLAHGRGKVIVPKKSINEQIRYDANKGQIVGYQKGEKKRVVISQRQRTVVKIFSGDSLKRRTFSGGGDGGMSAARAFVFGADYDDPEGIWEGVEQEFWDGDTWAAL